MVRGFKPVNHVIFALKTYSLKVLTNWQLRSLEKTWAVFPFYTQNYPEAKNGYYVLPVKINMLFNSKYDM